MEKSTFRVLVILSFCTITFCQFRIHIYNRTRLSWDKARAYCQQYYQDLSVISTSDETNKLYKVAGPGFNAGWIGLSRPPVNPSIWQWCNGEPVYYYNWASFQPDNYKGDQYCARLWPNGWDDDQCNDSMPFFCMTSTAYFVQEDLTWEEALYYCRKEYTDLVSISTSQDMVGLYSLSQLDAYLWTGLRFMAGNWLWVNGAPVQNWILNQLPKCPAAPQQCGAFNPTNWNLQVVSCSDRRGFFCY